MNNDEVYEAISKRTPPYFIGCTRIMNGQQFLAPSYVRAVASVVIYQTANLKSIVSTLYYRILALSMIRDRIIAAIPRI
jgi:hypothetical protein